MNTASILILSATAAVSLLALFFSIRRAGRGCDNCPSKDCPARRKRSI